MIQELINKQDNFEIVRDQIASILVLETANQQTLAVAAGQDPALWNLKIYSERSFPWESYLNDPSNSDAPIVNVWYDNSSFDKSRSNTMERQDTNGIFNIDCHGVGVSQDIAEGGHVSGDQQAALNAQRAVRLVRNMIMASQYTYLKLRGLVGSRWPQAISMFQIKQDSPTAQSIVGARMTMAVRFNEFSPQYVPETLDLISVGIKRKETGELILLANYDYTQDT